MTFSEKPMRLYHRTTVAHRTLRAGTFFSESPLADESFGPVVLEVEVPLCSGATDDDVVAAATALGIALPEDSLPYELLSPRLVGPIISTDDAEALMGELRRRGYDHALVSDFCCPLSVVVLSEVTP